MRFGPLIFSALTLVAHAVQAKTIGFEDVAVVSSSALLPPDYQGFVWSGAYSDQSWIVSSSTSNSGFSGTVAHSGSNFAWSNGGGELDLTAADGGDFDFLGMWARGGAGDIHFLAHAYRNGVEVYDQLVQHDMDYSQDTFGFLDVDRVVFDAQGANMLIDDINIVRTVAEPSSLALMLGGAFAAGTIARRRRTRAGI